VNAVGPRACTATSAAHMSGHIATHMHKPHSPHVPPSVPAFTLHIPTHSLPEPWSPHLPTFSRPPPTSWRPMCPTFPPIPSCKRLQSRVIVPGERYRARHFCQCFAPPLRAGTLIRVCIRALSFLPPFHPPFLSPSPPRPRTVARPYPLIISFYLCQAVHTCISGPPAPAIHVPRSALAQARSRPRWLRGR
jgi:hypothetical protein